MENWNISSFVVCILFAVIYGNGELKGSKHEKLYEHVH